MKLLLIGPLPPPPSPRYSPPPFTFHALSRTPTLTHAQSLTLPLSLALSRILSICRSHTDIPVPLTPFMNWAKTKRASVTTLHQKKQTTIPCIGVTMSTFLYKHPRLSVTQTQTRLSVTQTRGKKGLLRFLCFAQFTKGVKTTIVS